MASLREASLPDLVALAGPAQPSAAERAVAARRETLAAAPNPASGRDYVVTLSARLGGAGHLLTLRYVPDGAVLEAAGFAAWIAALDALDGYTPEALVNAALDDVSNELLPRWAQVSLSAGREGASHDASHDVVAEDRQPNWSNRALLSGIHGENR